MNTKQQPDMEEEASPLPPAPGRPRQSTRTSRPIGKFWKCVAKHTSRALHAPRRRQSLALLTLPSAMWLSHQGLARGHAQQRQPQEGQLAGSR